MRLGTIPLPDLPLPKLDEDPTDSRLWVWLFYFCLIFTLMVQGVLLNFLAPHLSAGWGLIRETDAEVFHYNAQLLVLDIYENGWLDWQFRYREQGIVGIMGVIYYFTACEPFVLAPLHSALYATGGVALVRMLGLFTPSKRVAFWCAAPYFFMPTTIYIFSQISKDIYTVPGYLLFVKGWVFLSHSATWEGGFGKRALRQMGAILSGGLLCWIGRPYMVVHVMTLFAFASVFLLIVVWGRRCLGGQMRWGSFFLAVVMSAVVLLAYRMLPMSGIWWKTTDEVKSVDISSTGHSPALEVVAALVPPLVSPAEASPPQEWIPAWRKHLDGDPATRVPPPLPDPVYHWQTLGFLPTAVENKIFAMAQVRLNFLAKFPQARSNMDADVRFGNALEVIAYLPRALLIGIFSPFPDQWWLPASWSHRQTRGMMWVAATLETATVYAALLFLPVILWRYRKAPQTMLIFFHPVGMIAVYALAIPNLGTLYRFRFGFLVILVGLGVAGAVAAVSWFRARGGLAAGDG